MKKPIIVVGALAGLCVIYVLAHLALIEVGREVVVVYEPTPAGPTHRARLWIVDQGSRSWIHPGNANAHWWVAHMDANSYVGIERGGQTRRYHVVADPDSHATVHRLLRAKYGIADAWVRFLVGSDTRRGLITRIYCNTTPIRLEPADGMLRPSSGGG